MEIRTSKAGRLPDRPGWVSNGVLDIVLPSAKMFCSSIGFREITAHPPCAHVALWPVPPNPQIWGQCGCGKVPLPLLGRVRAIRIQGEHRRGPQGPRGESAKASCSQRTPFRRASGAAEMMAMRLAVEPLAPSRIDLRQFVAVGIGGVGGKHGASCTGGGWGRLGYHVVVSVVS